MSRAFDGGETNPSSSSARVSDRRLVGRVLGLLWLPRVRRGGGGGGRELPYETRFADVDGSRGSGCKGREAVSSDVRVCRETSRVREESNVRAAGLNGGDVSGEDPSVEETDRRCGVILTEVAV